LEVDILSTQSKERLLSKNYSEIYKPLEEPKSDSRNFEAEDSEEVVEKKKKISFVHEVKGIFRVMC